MGRREYLNILCAKHFFFFLRNTLVVPAILSILFEIDRKDFFFPIYIYIYKR